jgi:Tfp pilus assembly protein PilN
VRPVNLLPRVRRSERRGRAAAIAAAVLVAVIGLLGFGVFWWEGRVGEARDALADQLSVNLSLERDVAALAPAAALRTDYRERSELVRVALARDVDWGLLLNDLARLLPPRLWVESFSGTVSLDGPAFGRVSFSGVGFDFPDVSEWLRALDSEQFRGVTGTWVSSVARGVIGDSEVVNFSSTASLTPSAASGRADGLIPEVP